MRRLRCFPEMINENYIMPLSDSYTYLDSDTLDIIMFMANF